MPATLTGTTADPQFRHQRAKKAASRRHSVDTYIQSIVDRAPELTEAQRAKLAGLLHPTGAEAPAA